ncbi:hypothetical protein DRP04_12340 [Archaeoglobales archaeon]|nr:MAG: hypothetical protein DRP04_12340 [Archaeoglobales archaeon]
MNEEQDIFSLIDKQFKELPVHKRFQKLENLIADELNDALTDLSEEEINTTTIFCAFSKYFGDLPILEFLLKKKLSLMRSRDRLGRQEYLQGLKETKEVLIPQPIPHKTEEEQKTTQKVSLIRRIFSRGRRE